MEKQFNIDLGEYFRDIAGNPERILYQDSRYYRKDKISVSLKTSERKYVPDDKSERPNKSV